MIDGQGIDVVFCDDSRMPDMPQETPEQAAMWESEKKQLTEKYCNLLNETA